MQACHQVFRAGAFTSWDSMCEDVTAFLTQIGKGNVIGVSQSEDENSAVIVVWYWN